MYTFIVNPNARTGLGLKMWRKIESALKERGVKYASYLTKYQAHASSIARRVTSEPGIHTIVILGGDGTINEVINGIVDLSKVTLGYIPIGSSNDFARSMGLSTEPLSALEHILAPQKYAGINTGILECGEKKRCFAVSAGIGFDAEVCHRLPFSRLKPILNRIFLGKLSYVGVALQSLMLQSPKKMSVTLDSGKTISYDKVYFAAVMNQRYEGGGFMFCPKADPCDGFLDIFIAEGLPKLKILFLLPTAFFGKHTRFSGIHTYRCRRADIKSAVSLPIHTDGEPVLSQNNISAYLAPQKIRLIIS